MDAHGKPCHVHPLRPPLLPTREHIQPTNPSRRHRPLLPDPRHPRLHPPVPTHKPVGKHAHQLLPRRQVGPPPEHNGAGEGDAEGALHPPRLQLHVPHGTEVPLPPIRPGRHLLGPGRIRLPGGQGDPVQGGVGVGLAQLVAGRLGHHHLARHMPPGGAGLAASRTPRALRPLTAHTAGLAWCPSTAGACGLGATGAFGGLGVLLRQSGPGLVLALGVVPNIRRPSGERDLHADVGRCARHKLRKGEWTRGNGRAKGANWTKFTEIRTKFVRNSYEFRTNFTSGQNSHKFIHVKFVRNSYEVRTNFVRISHLDKIHTNLFT